MLREYASLWDETLGEINFASSRINLVPETRRIPQEPYRAGHKARKIESLEVKKM